MLAAFAFVAAQSNSHVETFNINGVTREALVYSGAGPVPAGGRPLVFAFHGHGGNMNLSERGLNVQSLWPEAMVIYPQGLPTKGMTDPQGTKNGWQQKPGDEGDRDIKFVDAMLAWVKGVNRHRIYSMGHSNGGRFTYVLWATRGDQFAAYGPSGSPTLTSVRSFKPAPMFATAGENDPIVPFRGQLLSIQAVARLDGIDLSKGTKNGYITLANGTNGLEIGTYISPMGHSFPPDAVAATVALFKRH
jgi:polyhydroxybutyrate depolymerase